MSWKDRLPGYRLVSGGIKRLRDVVVFLPLAATVLLVRLIRPLLLVRFGRINGARIGHFCFETDLYLAERNAGLHPRRSLDLFYYESPPCNAQVDKMFRRVLWITQIARRLDGVNRAIPGGESHVVKILGRDTHKVHRDTHNLLSESPANIQLTRAEIARGEKELAALGVPPEAPLVCIHNRDSAYLRRIMPQYDWSYHDYRDFCVKDFRPAIEELVRRGYYVVRVGQDVEEPLEMDSPRVIDYATLGGNNFLDVYLAWRCRFFVGNSAGLFLLATTLRRPTLLVNLVPMEGCSILGTRDLSIPKLLRDRSTGRTLTFAETVARGAASWYWGQQFAEAELEVINTDPEEIRSAVVEMDGRLAGTWNDDPRDLELAVQFRRVFEEGGLLGAMRSRLAATFLRRHADLLVKQPQFDRIRGPKSAA